MGHYRQWERRIETDVILNVYGMLWEYKSRHEEGDCSRQSEQQCERHGSQYYYDKLDCATDKTLAEADHKALQYVDCADEVHWQDMEGLPVLKALKVRVAISNLIQALMGSQWNLFRVDELESVKPVPVIRGIQELLQLSTLEWKKSMNCSFYLTGQFFRSPLGLHPRRHWRSLQNSHRSFSCI